MSEPRIWLLSAYHADSHAWWAEWLRRELPGQWQLFTLPGRHFRWRLRGNPLSWLDRLPHEPPDAIIATSMVDLSTLRGLRPELAGVPSLLYFHENQFAYPVSSAQHSSIDPQMVQLYASLCATRIVFNSVWNRDSFLSGIEHLSERLPDHCPGDLAGRIRPRCQVLPVPVQPVRRLGKDGRLILWNHRWEYDKAPGRFAMAVAQLIRSGAGFRLALLGPRGRRTPPSLERIRSLAGNRVLVDGHVDRKAYQRWLGHADIVVSTATHEFQGLAVLEAVSAGAAPLVPDALCYREQYPEAFRYPAGDVDALARRLEDWLVEHPAAPDVSPYLEESLRGKWAATLRQLLEGC